jgi:hypothetical protein
LVGSGGVAAVRLSARARSSTAAAPVGAGALGRLAPGVGIGADAVDGGLGAVAFGDGVGPVAVDGFQLLLGAGQLLLEAGVLALQLVDPALGVAASRLELLAPRAPGPGGAEGEEQEQGHQEAEGGGQDQQLTLAELAE